jgi:hypothetical protein
MNVTQATAAVQARGFDYLSDDRVLLMLNAAKSTFEDIYEWPWLVTGAAGPTPLNVPDLKLILNVKTTDTIRELLGLDIRQTLLGDVNPLLPGVPEFWFIEGASTLHVTPGDGASINVIYVADSPELVAGTDTPRIPSRYHHLWIDYAVVEAYKDSDNFTGAQALRSDIAFRMQDVIMRYETRNRQHSPFMTVRNWHGDD